MYQIRQELSENCDDTFTYLKDGKKPEVKIGNFEGKIIQELQDKLHQCNMKIRDLKNKISEIRDICEYHQTDEYAVTQIWNIVSPQNT